MTTRGPDEAPACPAAERVMDPIERQAAHITDMLCYCGHWLHFKGGGRAGRAPILCALLKHGGSMSQRELMGSLDLKAGSLSEVLCKLEECGQIERLRDPADRRQLRVSLTPEGEAQASHSMAVRTKFRSEGYSCLTLDERGQLEDLLARITRHWRTLDD